MNSIFSLIKVVTIQVFIIAGGLAVFGVIPLSDGSPAPYFFSNLTEGGLFPKGSAAAAHDDDFVNFAFPGTELIGVAAGETQNPEKVILMAGTTVVRLCFLLHRHDRDPRRASSDGGRPRSSKSPFVTVFERIGIPVRRRPLNFVILTVISAANSEPLCRGPHDLGLAHDACMPAWPRSTKRESGQRHHASMPGGWSLLSLGLRCRYGLRSLPLSSASLPSLSDFAISVAHIG